MKRSNYSKTGQIILFAMPSILSWLFVLLIYWPGLMSHDSVVQWGEIITGQYTDYHPAFHTLYELLISRLFWGSPAAIAIVQILALSFLCGWGISYFYEIGVKPWVCWCSAFVFALLPVNFVLVNTLWKDVPFSIAMFALSIVFLKIYKTNGKWLRGFHIAILGLLLVLISLFRHNGIAVAILCIFSLIALYPGSFKLILSSLIVSAVLYFGVTHILYPNLKVKPATDFTYGVFSYYIGAHLNSGTDFSKKELQFLDQVMPLSEDWYYSCQTNESLILTDDGKAKADLLILESNKKEFYSIFIKANLRNPTATINHVVCTTAYIWNPRAPLGGRYPIRTKPNIWWVSSNPHGLISSSLLPAFVKPLTTLIKLSDYIFWRPALYLFGCLIICGVLLIKNKNLKCILPFLPALFNTLILLFITPSQEFRYQYPVVLTTIFFIPLLILEFNNNNNRVINLKVD